MTAEVPATGAAAAGDVLTGLLTTRTAYLRRWEQHAQRRRSSGISYAAISQVVALYLWDTRQREDTDTELPRRLRDRITRALDGKKATHETLTWLMEAFDMSDEDRETVWSAFSGGPEVDNVKEGVAFTLRNPKPPMNRVQRHRTMALFKRYYIGDDRTLRQADAHHVIMSLDDGLTMYGHSPIDTLKDFQCISGHRKVIRYESAPGFVGVDIELERPLSKGQTVSLQYVATYHPTPTPCLEVRRAARARTTNVDMRVCFDGPAPKRAWWCVWEDHIDGEPCHSEPVDVTAYGELHRFIPFIEQTVVGFRWEW